MFLWDSQGHEQRKMSNIFDYYNLYFFLSMRGKVCQISDAFNLLQVFAYHLYNLHMVSPLHEKVKVCRYVKSAM